jgi:hypothetical protein
MHKTDFLGNELNYECLGCSIHNKEIEIPGGIIFESDKFIVHQDPFIPLPGFLIFSSKRHIKSISEMSVSEYDEFFRIVEKARNIIKKFIPIHQITVVQEDNSEHFNLWFFPWTSEIIEDYGEPDTRKVSYILEDLRARKIDGKNWKILSNLIKLITKSMNKED